MARVAGIEIPKNKRGLIALTYVFGVGKSRSKLILNKAKVDINKKVIDWSDDEVSRVREIISEFIVEGELRSKVRRAIKRLIDIGSYRGRRHKAGLPLRGQKTKNNSRTRKGKRKTVANKKKAS